MKRDYLAKLGLTKEALEKAGLDETVIDKIMAENGSDIEAAKKTAGSKLSEIETENETLKRQLAETQTKMEEFKNMKSPQEVEAAVNDWKVKVAEAEKTHKETVAAIKQEHALERELEKTFKAKNIKAVAALLNKEGLKFDEKTETFIGLKEQIEPLQKSDAYLFSSGKEPPRFIDQSGKPSSNDGNQTTFAEAINERLQAQKQ